MSIYQLRIQLLSDTTFGRGDGVAGLIDQEVEHDSYGFPYLRGRTLKGLLTEECDNLITLLPDEHKPAWEKLACQLFGKPGSGGKSMGIVRFGDACLPDNLRKAVALQIEQEASNKKPDALTKTQVLDSLTTIRRQTAIDPQSGVADEGSLRSYRVVIRELCFTADLMFEKPPNNAMLSLLEVGALALRRIGSGRNRGRGHVRCTLHNDKGKDITHQHINDFGTEIKENV